ncbi:MAG: hypothetical protein WC779_00230 [Candidatus Omnitrophota bacterium]
MNIAKYLKLTESILAKDEQREWFKQLKGKAENGRRLFRGLSQEARQELQVELSNRIRTEEIKAWYSSPENDSLFQGTSISSLTIPYETRVPLKLRSVMELEENIADAYIELHNRYASRVRNTIMENVDNWIKEGLYYGVALSSKLVSQAFDLSVSRDEVVFDIKGRSVDPHEIMSYPEDIRQEYFRKCVKSIDAFSGIDMEQRELESSLVLADISKPKIKKYKDKIILAPIRCNEIAAIFSARVTKLIIEKTSGKISPKSLSVIIYDTDTPYTYHKIMGYRRDGVSPVLPGLIVMGSSGTIDAFRWMYAYRVSLIAQKIMKSSLYSQIHKSFIPFVFFGVLVPRDAEILLDMSKLHMLRYRGNMDPEIEFCYILEDYLKSIEGHSRDISWEDFSKKHLI